jgi:hypothetical protein
MAMNQSLHLTKDRFAWIILSYVILSALDVNNISSLGRYDCLDIYDLAIPFNIGTPGVWISYGGREGVFTLNFPRG